MSHLKAYEVSRTAETSQLDTNGHLQLLTCKASEGNNICAESSTYQGIRWMAIKLVRKLHNY
jgi:hypothetical protein